MWDNSEYNYCCRKPRSYRLKSQVAIIAISSLQGLNTGMSIGHAGVLIPQIQADNGTLYVDDDTASWIASVYSFASPLGCLLGGILSEMLGRRFAIMIAFASMSIGWLSIAVSKNVGLVLAGRCIEGVSKSMVATAVTVLADETLQPMFRGFMFTHYGTMLSMGIFAMMGLADMMTWRTSSMVAFGLSAMSSMCVMPLPESPTWLVRKGHLGKADVALRRLWGASRRDKARQILQNLKAQYTVKEEPPGSVISRISRCKKILKPRFLKPFLIIHTFNVSIHLLCGNHLVINYGVDMASRMTNQYDPYIVNTILSVIRTVVCIVVALSMTFFGRRAFVLVSGIGTALSSIALAGVLYVNVGFATTTSVVLLGLYVAFFTSGYFMVPTIMIGETLPAAVRSYLCGYIYTINDFTGGGVVKMYPWLLRTLHLHGMFLVFGISCAICALFAYLFLPETNGKTLEEIEEYFQQDNVMWLTRPKARSAETRGLCEESVSSKL